MEGQNASEDPQATSPAAAEQQADASTQEGHATGINQQADTSATAPKLTLDSGLFRDKLKYHYNMLADQHKDSLTLTSGIQSLVKIRIGIEKNYAKSTTLSDAAKPKNWLDKLLAGQSSEPNVAQFGSVGKMVQQMFGCTGVVAAAHSVMAQELQNKVLQPLEDYGTSSSLASEQLRNRMSLPAQELEQAMRNIQRAKERAHRAMKQCEKKQRDLEQEVKKSTGCTMSGIMERETRVHDLAAKADEEDVKYKQAIKEAQEFQRAYFDQELPTSLDMYQEQVELRYAELHKLFTSYCEISSQSVIPSQAANVKLKQAVSSLDISQDLVPLFEQAERLAEEAQLEQPIQYIPFPGSYWSMPSEDDVGVREGTWEKRSIVGSNKRTLGMPQPLDFVSSDDVTVMEQQAREQGVQLCSQGEALLKTGDYERALVKFTRANEKCSFGNDEDGVARAAAGIQMSEDMQGAWSQATNLRTEGAALLRSGEFAAASAKFVEAMTSYENSGNHAECLEALIRILTWHHACQTLAAGFSVQGRVPQDSSPASWSGAKRADEGLKDSETRRIAQEEGQKNCDAADALVTEANFEGAASMYAEAEKMFRKAHDTLGIKRSGDGQVETKKIVAARKQAATLMTKGEAMSKREKFSEAIGAFEQAEKKFGEGHDDVGVTAAAERITAVSEQINSSQAANGPKVQ